MPTRRCSELAMPVTGEKHCMNGDAHHRAGLAALGRNSMGAMCPRDIYSPLFAL